MIDHLADLRSDLSRFHRVDDIELLDGPQFMEMAWRISAYGGVIAMRLQDEQEKRGTAGSPTPSRAGRGPGRGPAGSRTVGLAALMASDPTVVDRQQVS